MIIHEYACVQRTHLQHFSKYGICCSGLPFYKMASLNLMNVMHLKSTSHTHTHTTLTATKTHPFETQAVSKGRGIHCGYLRQSNYLKMIFKHAREKCKCFPESLAKCTHTLISPVYWGWDAGGGGHGFITPWSVSTEALSKHAGYFLYLTLYRHFSP